MRLSFGSRGIAALALTAALGLSAPAGATTWDAVADFTTIDATGASGVWAYGFDEGSGFTPFDTANAGTCFPASECWQHAGPDLAYSVPIIAKTIGAYTNDFGTVVQPIDVLNLHPGAKQPYMLTDIDVIVRFIAPTAGVYRYKGFYEVLDIAPGAVNAYANGVLVPLSGAASHPGVTGPRTYFGGGVSLAAGDVIDFRVNRAGAIWDDSTGLSATISSAPEPAAWAMMIGGFGLSGGLIRRRRSLAA